MSCKIKEPLRTPAKRARLERLELWLRYNAQRPYSIFWHQRRDFGAPATKEIHHDMGGGVHHKASSNVGTCLQCLDDFLEEKVTEPELKHYG